MSTAHTARVQCIAALAAACITGFASAQVTVPASNADQHYNSTASNTDFGESVLITEDFDGDGWRDIIVGAVGFDASPPPPARGLTLNNTGAALLFSSQSGALIRVFPGFQADGTIGFDIVQLPDRNSDGVVDFAVGGPRLDTAQIDAGGFVVFSGADAQILGGAMGSLGTNGLVGWSLAAIGDITSDGISEIAAGAPGAESVVIYNGDTLAEITTLSGTQANAGFGWSVRGAGDVNNDGTPDIIVGVPFYDTTNIDPDPNAGGADVLRTDSGRAVVYSGSDFSVLYTLERHDLSEPHELFSPFQNFGTRVDGLGDINNDNHDDIIVGAPETTQGSGGAGHVMVFSGLDGSVIYDIDGPPLAGEKHGERVVNLGDVDGDGVNDFAASSNQSCFTFPGCGRPGAVITYSGATGLPVTQYNGELSNDSFGASIAAADLDGDNGIDIVISAIFHNAPPNSPGEVYLFRGDPIELAEDITGDGLVNLFDLLLLLDNWGTSAAGADIAEPFDVVDLFDLLAMLDAWTG